MARPATTLCALLPHGPGPEREKALFDFVAGGELVPVAWAEVTLTAGEHRATAFVSVDAIQIGDGTDNVRIDVCATTAQRIADLLGAHMQTTRICDAVWAQAAVRIPPCFQTPDEAMSNTDRMVLHSRTVDERRNGRQGLVENVGKHWVLTNRLAGQLGQAANYGWYDAQALDGRLWQPLGLAHSVSYTDYSQVLRLVRGDMIVDGRVRPFLEIAADPILSALVSSEGPLRVTRLPAVPKTAIAVPSPSVPPPPPPGEAVPFRELSKGMRGPDVAAWQRQLIVDGHSLGPWKDDGVFGAATYNATLVWQTLRGLPPSGLVDAATRAAAGTPPAPPRESIDPIPFLAARHFTPANRTAVDWIVMHTMEADEASGTAEHVAQWFAGASAPQASAHYCVDVDSIVQCVKDEDVAWHAPGANAKGIGIELAGYARQSLEEWVDPYSTRTLKRAATLAARLARKWNVPIAFVDRNGLVSGARGITTHNEVTWAFRESTHTDPGPHFPMDAFLAWVKLG